MRVQVPMGLPFGIMILQNLYYAYKAKSKAARRLKKMKLEDGQNFLFDNLENSLMTLLDYWGNNSNCIHFAHMEDAQKALDLLKRMRKQGRINWTSSEWKEFAHLLQNSSVNWWD